MYWFEKYCDNKNRLLSSCSGKGLTEDVKSFIYHSHLMLLSVVFTVFTLLWYDNIGSGNFLKAPSSRVVNPTLHVVITSWEWKANDNVLSCTDPLLVLSPQKSLSQPDSSSGGSSVSGGNMSKWLWSIGPFSCKNTENHHETIALYWNWSFRTSSLAELNLLWSYLLIMQMYRSKVDLSGTV